jgi:pyruvate kinase
MVASIVEKVRRFAGDRARIMVDLPTNKVRVMNISKPIVFGAGDTFVIHGFQAQLPGRAADVLKTRDIWLAHAVCQQAATSAATSFQGASPGYDW